MASMHAQCAVSWLTVPLLQVSELTTQLPRTLAIPCSIPEMQIPWRWPEAGMAAPSDVVAIVAGGRCAGCSVWKLPTPCAPKSRPLAPGLGMERRKRHPQAVHLAAELRVPTKTVAACAPRGTRSRPTCAACPLACMQAGCHLPVRHCPCGRRGRGQRGASLFQVKARVHAQP